jgi:hypothetical protein
MSASLIALQRLVTINEKVRVDYQFAERDSLGIEVPRALSTLKVIK